MRLRIVAIFVLLLAGVALLGRYFWFRPQSSLKTVRVEKGGLELSVSFSGKLKAKNQVSLSFPISGRLIEVASEGATVKEGEVVAQLDSFDLYSAYLGTLANLNKARSSHSNAVEAKAVLDATYAGREAENLVKAKLAEGRTNVEAAAAAVENAKYLADQSWANLAKAVLRSPLSGVVTESPFKVGEVAPALGKTVTVTDLSSFYFEAEADEVDVGSLQRGDRVALKLDAFGEVELPGVISVIDAVYHTTASGGTAYDVKIEIENDRGLTLRSGLNGEANLVRELRQNVLIVPAAFVTERDGKSFVKVRREGGRSEEREVTLGEFASGRYEVRQGLAEGEAVVQENRP